MKKLKIVEKTLFSPEEIKYGVRFGEHKGNSTITDVYINSDSLEEKNIDFRIYGSIEREGLVKIFKTIAKIIEENYE